LARIFTAPASKGVSASRLGSNAISTLRIVGILSASLFLIGWTEHCAAQSVAPVRSLLEIRQQNVVIQQWDLSCGAAALATILNYQHGDPVTEKEVAIGMMGREEYIENPMVVRYRQGFSLLDLKSFVDDRGYNGVGLGQLRFEDLVDYAPIIVPISTHGYQHFVVFRGVLRDRVLVADPAFGNRALSRDRFESAWRPLPEVGRIGFYVERRDNLIPPDRLKPTAEDGLIQR
jgi:predicted double-glycine peptidase